ncbi:response regulator [Salsuginibacillus kocurii]|uniref:response regulator n=1 Tax=Salsuginibacillus kocurii TaxID=427078 RepID=UPI0003727257|nr:response regulator transcription factor [Salsuginibacillus kocurii]
MDVITLMVVDDHHIVRKGLVFYFEHEEQYDVKAEASNGKEALTLLESYQVDVILLDLSMPELDGVETTKHIKARNADQKILVLTSFEDQDHVIAAIQAGADGYCLKDTEPDDLLEAIRQVAHGHKNIDPKVAPHLLQHVHQEKSEETLRLQSLTKREREVLREITKGNNNGEIALALHITEKTVKTHITNLFSKLDVCDRTQAALLAVKHKL